MRLPRFIILRSKEARVYIVVVLLLAFTFSFGVFERTREFAQAQLYATGQGMQTLIQFVFYKKGNLQSEVDRLTQEVSNYTSTLAENELLLSENAELRSAITTIAARPTIFGNARVAYVIHKSSSSREHSIKINLGSNNQVEVNDVVTTTEGYLIGIIESVDTDSSTVRLLQDIDSSIPANVLGTRNTRGLVQGESGFVLKLSFIPTEAEIEQGLFVVTSGLEGRYPPGLVIGSITEIHVTEKDPFKNGDVKPFIDARDITTLLVL